MMHKGEVYNMCTLPGIVQIVKFRGLRWARETNSYRTQFGEHTFGFQCINMIWHSGKN
jgi:hypothetical protein